MGFEMVGPSSVQRDADGAGYPSKAICSYMQACGQTDFSSVDGVIFTHCCSSAKRLFDYVQYRYPHQFLSFIELPSRMDDEGKTRLRRQYRILFRALRDRFGCPEPVETPVREQHYGNGAIWLLGSGVHPDWVASARRVLEGEDVYPCDCLSSRHGDRILSDEPVPAYCSRSLDFMPWVTATLSDESIRAVIGVSSPKCDYALFTMPLVRDTCRARARPFLWLEEEFGSSVSEHNRIRLEAFQESLPVLRRERADGKHDG